MSDSYETSIINNTSSSSSGGSDVFEHNGGPLYVSMQGNFDGATITIEASDDRSTTGTYGTATDMISGNTLSVAAGTTDVYYAGKMELPPCWVRATATANLGGSTNVTVAFSNVP